MLWCEGEWDCRLLLAGKRWASSCSFVCVRCLGKGGKQRLLQWHLPQSEVPQALQTAWFVSAWPGALVFVWQPAVAPLQGAANQALGRSRALCAGLCSRAAAARGHSVRSEAWGRLESPAWLGLPGPPRGNHNPSSDCKENERPAREQVRVW